jgi:multicomponent Na+:H+ antiporter subunit A
MIALIALHLAIAIASRWLARWLGGGVFVAAALAPAATVAWAAWHAPAVLAGRVVVETFQWAPDLGFELALRVDAFSLVMIALVSGIGVLILWYSAWYFRKGPDNGRLAGLLVAFAGAMLGVVVSDNLIAIYLFWELTSITSYLLIGFEDHSALARMAALRALLITEPRPISSNYCSLQSCN